MKKNIEETFKKYFKSIGKSLFPEQIEVIKNVLEGKNTLCLMPTGSGKSLCYWISGKILGGITIVISPLTALMDEQAIKLKAHGIDVYVLHSGIDTKKQYEELICLYNGNKPDFIFSSPERIATDGFLEFVLKKIRDDIKLFVIDEIHCISQWGYDFRPFYKEIPYFLKEISGGKLPIILGLTATLNPKDKEEICKDFNILEINVIKSRFMLRNNILTKIIRVQNENEKDELFWKTLEEKRGEKILVYVDRKKGKRSTEYLCRIAKDKGFKAEYFHSERTNDEKIELIEMFKSGEILLLFATSAFGMGIDIPDIRGIIHYLPPESVEQYYQQIGRAGRDWKNSWALLYYSNKNLEVRRSYYIDKSFPKEEDIVNSFSKITDNKIGKKTFIYFDEEDSKSSYHYLIRSDAIRLICKGFQSINVFEPINNAPEFNELKEKTKAGLLIKVARELNIPEKDLLEKIYFWLVTGRIMIKNSPSKCLVIESKYEKIPEDKLCEIRDDIESKKLYKYCLFDKFVDIINNYQNHSQFQQTIGEYLGIDMYELGRIHQTLSGDLVRSKSEVIIANILFDRGIKFDYEMELSSPDGQTLKPDFTIECNGKLFYWEHLGLLDNEEYCHNWEIKNKLYETYFPGQLLITKESKILSKDAEKIIKTHFKN